MHYIFIFFILRGFFFQLILFSFYFNITIVTMPSTNEANNFISKVICIYVGKLESIVPTVGKNIKTKQTNPIMITK